MGQSFVDQTFGVEVKRRILKMLYSLEQSRDRNVATLPWMTNGTKKETKKELDDAVNFGGIGAVIGHELTHGFDDEGRKFDPQGNLRDWWTPVDAREFEKRATCISDQYSGFNAVDDLKLNGKLTLGENTADNGGARIALVALLSSLQQQAKASPSDDALSRKIDGFTPEQRFFLGFATVWCENRSDEYSRFLVTVDPHSPGRWRTNGVLQNMPEFQKAFSCKPAQAMVSANACRVW